jgi:hypothetical protein
VTIADDFEELLAREALNERSADRRRQRARQQGKVAGAAGRFGDALKAETVNERVLRVLVETVDREREVLAMTDEGAQRSGAEEFKQAAAAAVVNPFERAREIMRSEDDGAKSLGAERFDQDALDRRFRDRRQKLAQVPGLSERFGEPAAHRLEQENLLRGGKRSDKLRKVRRLADDLIKIRAQLFENLAVVASVEHVERDGEFFRVADFGAFAADRHGQPHNLA